MITHLPLGKKTGLFLLTIFLLLHTSTHAQIITTVAGGNIGDGKTATTIGLASADALVADANENIYFLDRGHNCIRRIDAATNIITTVAGGGNNTLSEGAPALSVDLFLSNIQDGIALDSHNHLYFLCFSEIVQLDLGTGLIHIVAGKINSTPSGDGGPIANATINFPLSLAVDNQDNLYFADYNSIRKVTLATGIVNTIAGNGTKGYTGDGGPATSAELALPNRITVDNNGNVFVADNNNYAIRKITAATGIISTICGGHGASNDAGDGGPATAANVSSPWSLGTDATGNLYISDYGRVRVISASTGIISPVTASSTNSSAATGDGGLAINTSFSNCEQMTSSPGGNVYLVGYLGATIRKIAAGTTIVSTVGGNGLDGVSGIPGPALSAQLNSPKSIAVDHTGNVFLADQYNNRIYRIDASTHQIQNFVTVTNPGGMAVDGAGNLYYTSNSGLYVMKATPTGAVSTFVGSGIYGHTGDGGPATSARINRADGLAFDNTGNLYIADVQNNCIRKVTAGGIITTIAGTGTQGYTGDGSAAINATFNNPLGVCVDQKGNVYVADNGNNVVRKIDAAAGIITTAAGTGIGGYGGDNGLATTAKLDYPYGVITDSLNNLYISDQFNQRVRKVTITTGIITTFAGDGSSIYNGDNIPANTAGISNPVGMAFDNSWNMYVTDWTNGRLREITNAMAATPTGVLTGIVFYDDNGNGIWDPNEAGADNITASAIKAGVRQTTTSRNGIFKLQTDTGSYTVSIDSLPYYTVTPASRSLQLVTNPMYDSAYFALQPIAGKQDLKVTLLPLTRSRPGLALQYRLFYQNAGTTTVDNTTLAFVSSNKTYITSTIPAYDSLSTDSATAFWHLGRLTAHQSGSVDINANAYPPPVTNIGDYLHYTTYIGPATGDLTPGDDTARLIQIATGSYDPNEKTESHEGIITPAQVASGEYLDYTIRFQNTGNDTAFTVLVRDTLDTKLDASTLHMMETSHDYQLAITNGNDLTFTFNNIRLPDSSTNKAASQGFIHFLIRPKNTVQPGDDIAGRSSIYFDYNLPVTTNTVHTLVGALPALPPKPVANTIATSYCATASQQTIALANLPTAASAWVKLNGTALALTAGNQFTMTPAQLAQTKYSVKIGYSNAAGESSAVYPFTITPASTPVVTLSADKTTLTSASDEIRLSAVARGGGGTTPLYTFAKDRAFAGILQAESPANTFNVQSSDLAIGDNWLYVRMKTSDTCFTRATAVDSIKLSRTASTIGITDPDNPGIMIIGYPIPFTRQITLTGLSDAKTYAIVIYNSTGVQLQSLVITGAQNAIINTNAWSAGSYWISITDTKRNRRLGTLHVNKL